MQQHERAMLDFVHPWLTYGGPPPEDIFIRFGIGPRTFYQRLQAVLIESDMHLLKPSLRREVAELCDRHLDNDRDRNQRDACVPRASV